MVTCKWFTVLQSFQFLTGVKFVRGWLWWPPPPTHTPCLMLFTCSYLNWLVMNWTWKKKSYFCQNYWTPPKHLLAWICLQICQSVYCQMWFQLFWAETQSLSTVIFHHQLLQGLPCSGILSGGLHVNHLQPCCTELIARGWCKKQNNGEWEETMSFFLSYTHCWDVTCLAFCCEGIMGNTFSPKNGIISLKNKPKELG